MISINPEQFYDLSRNPLSTRISRHHFLVAHTLLLGESADDRKSTAQRNHDHQDRGYTVKPTASVHLLPLPLKSRPFIGDSDCIFPRTLLQEVPHPLALIIVTNIDPDPLVTLFSQRSSPEPCSWSRFGSVTRAFLGSRRAHPSTTRFSRGHPAHRLSGDLPEASG